MKTILQIIPSKTWGGGEVFVYNLSEALGRDKGYNVLFAGRRSRVVERCFEKLGKYHTLPFASMFDLYSVWRIAKIVREQGVGIIHTHIFQDAFLAVFAKKLFGLKDLRIVMTRHLVRKGKFSMLYRWLYRHLDSMIFVSDLSRKFFLSSAKVDTSQINPLVIHNSVPKRLFTHSSIRELYQIPATTKIIGYSGRIAHEKGIETIIDAAELLRVMDVVFLLVGTGERGYVERIETLVRDKNLEQKVRLLGFMDQVDNFVSQVDMALLPSVGREGFCLSVLEYMRYARPVITTNNGAQSEMITDGQDGFLMPVGDAQAAAWHIESLINDVELSENIGCMAAERAKDFAYDRFLDRMVEVYQT